MLAGEEGAGVGQHVGDALACRVPQATVTRGVERGPARYVGLAEDDHASESETGCKVGDPGIVSKRIFRN